MNDRFLGVLSLKLTFGKLYHQGECTKVTALLPIIFCCDYCHVGSFSLKSFYFLICHAMLHVWLYVISFSYHVRIGTCRVILHVFMSFFLPSFEFECMSYCMCLLSYHVISRHVLSSTLSCHIIFPSCRNLNSPCHYIGEIKSELIKISSWTRIHSKV